MNLRLKKVYTVSKKADKPRLFLQHIVCEAAGFEPGEELFIKVDEEKEEIRLQNYSFEKDENCHTVHVASRTNKISGKKRPLVDTAGEKYASFLDINQKVEINVFKQGNRSQIVVQPLKYRLFENSTMPTPHDERIRVLSVCAGSGVGTAALADSGYYTPIQEIELEDDSAEVLLHNFPNSMVFNGDLRNVQDVAEVDMAFVTLPCNSYSSLGDLSQGISEDLVLAASKIIQSSKASVLFFENVPKFYKSQAWISLKSLLSDDYPYWTEKEIEAWDFGSIATRKRTYCMATNSEALFHEFRFPEAPKMRRKKLKDYLDGKHVEHEWKSVAKWQESFNSREAWRDRSLDLTFVSKDVTKINCIPKRYSSHCASNSYVCSEDKKWWRLLSIHEIKKILGVPEWFQFCEHTQKIRKYEMLGQSVACQVIKSIANKIAFAFLKTKQAINKERKDSSFALNIQSNGQLSFF